MLSASDISLKIANKSLLENVNFAAKSGEFIGILGPNGAGKTSLLRSLMCMEERSTGSCNLWSMKNKERAQYAAWLAQERNVSWDLSVEEIIALGRLPWRRLGGRLHVDDARQIDQAIERLSLDQFRESTFTNLSGGERARVLIARLLAQNTPIIFADEPIAALDPAQALRVLNLFEGLAQEGRTVVMSIHDLSLAARFCTRILLMHEGRVEGDGRPLDVLSEDKIAKVFGIRAQRVEIENGLAICPIDFLENENE